MKFVISSTKLSSHLLTLGRIIAQKNSMPILNCFCFDIKGGTLEVTASDNDSTLTTTLELIESEEDIRFAVNAKTLQDAIKEIPEQPLDIFVNTANFEITIAYQNGQYKLTGQSAEDYPVPVFDDEGEIEVEQTTASLLHGISRAIVAAAVDTSRPQLNAVCFDVRNDSLSMVASNGNQLALTSIKNVGASSGEGVFLLAARPASVLKGILAKESGVVRMHFGQRGAKFETTEYTFSSRLVEGRYPNYRSVIPTANPISFSVNRTSIISVLRRVLIFANPQAVIVKMRIEPNSINISTQDMDFGMSAEENLLCDYSGQTMRIAFRGDSLMNMIQNFETDDITFKVSDPSRAALIVPTVEDEAEEVLMLLMPSVFND